MATIEAKGLSKRFGEVRAVTDLTFEAVPGKITGFLGPNGAGKTTTLRMLLGLVRPTAGEALVGGRPYRDLEHPTRVVGAVLDSAAIHPGRTGRDQLRIRAAATGIAPGRVDEVLGLVGLDGAAGRRIPTYSTGMRQRLGLAAALLGDPEVLLLDEPANGLDPEGIAWLRNLIKRFAAEGRTVLISSHLLSEVAQTVDRVVIVNRGRLRFAGSLVELGAGAVSVETGQLDELRDALGAAGLAASVTGSTSLEVFGATAEEVGRIAAARRIVLSGLDDNASLESAFLRLTGSLEAPAAQ